MNAEYNTNDTNIDWISKQAYQPTQLTISMLSENISLLDPTLAAAWKSLIEIHPREVTGFNNDFNEPDPKEKAQIILRPTFDYTEKFGKAVSMAVMRLKSLEHAILFHPRTPSKDNGLFTFIAIEPSLIHTQVVDAWICVVKRIKSFNGPSSDRRIRTIEEQNQHDTNLVVRNCSFELDCESVNLGMSFKEDGSNDVLTIAKNTLEKLNIVSDDPVSKYAARADERNRQYFANVNPEDKN